MIVAAMCTIPPRQHSFRQVLRRILDEQTRPVDRFYVWLNGYNSVPDDLPDDPRLILFLEPDNPGPWKRYDLEGKIEDHDVVLTLDDDLIYPTDYIEVSVSLLQQSSQSTSICFAGAFWDPVVPAEHLDFYAHRRWIPYTQELQASTPVSVIMGGIGVHWGVNLKSKISNELDGFSLNDDLMLSLGLQRSGVQIFSVPKSGDWIGEYSEQNHAHALWRTNRDMRSKTFQEMVQVLGFSPATHAMKSTLVLPCNLIISMGELPTKIFEKIRDMFTGIPLHTLEIIAGDCIGLTSRPLRDCHEHFVSIPIPGGRFEFVPGVRQWRQRRVEARGWSQVEQYLAWLEMSLNIQGVGLLASPDQLQWLANRLQRWLAGFPGGKKLQLAGVE